jgi:hypothetical protein
MDFPTTSTSLAPTLIHRQIAGTDITTRRAVVHREGNATIFTMMRHSTASVR